MNAPTARTTLLAAAAALHVRAIASGLNLRALPQEPTSCCGRGCQGCVWEAYDAALAYWLEDADLLLKERHRLQTGTACAFKGDAKPPVA